MKGNTDDVPAAASDINQIEEITRVVLEILASRRPTVSPADGGFFELLEKLNSYVALLVLAGSVVVAGVVWVAFDVSPLDSGKEIRGQRELTRRHIELGNDFLNVGQLQAAKIEFTRAKELGAYKSEADLGLLKVSVFEPVAAHEYDPEIAQRRLRAILKQKPNDSHALALLGDVNRDIDPEAALRNYDQALASDSDNTAAYSGRGILFDQWNRPADALAMYEQAVTRSPWNQSYVNNLAYQYYLRGNYRQAEELYIRLLKLDPRFLLSYCMLSNSQLLLGDTNSAYYNLLLLDDRLKDGDSAKLPRNQFVWFFHTGENAPVQLYSEAEKGAYARYLMALGAHLRGLSRDVQRHLSEIPTLSHRDAVVVRSIIDADILRLAKARPDFASKLRVFSVTLHTR